jgi:DNA-binding MarR family transcriptional regulator
VSTPLDEHLTNVLGAVALAIDDAVRSSADVAAGHGSAAPAALVALHEFLGGASMDQLRQATGLSPSGAVRLIDRLEIAGYVERQPGADARSVAVVLTPSGRAASKRVRVVRAEAVHRALADLNAGERRQLARLVDTILSTITEQRLADRDRGEPPIGGWLCRLCDFTSCGRKDGACPAATAAQGHYT